MPDWREFPTSSHIARALYNADARELTIEFRSSNSPYTFTNVDEGCYTGLCEAGSAGKFFHANIKGRYEHRRQEQP